MTSALQQSIISKTETLTIVNTARTNMAAIAALDKDDKLIHLMADHELQEAKFLTALRKFSQVEFTNHPSESELEIIKDRELAELLLIETRLAATPANSPTGISIKLALWRKYSLSIEPTIDEVDTITALVLAALNDAKRLANA